MNAHKDGDFVKDHERSIAIDIATAAATIGDAALSRVWLLGPGDLCASCAMSPECPDRRECLHLAASVGLTAKVDGPYRRFPLGAREVGRVARSLEPLVIDSGLAEIGLAETTWLARHRIASFAALPLIARGKCVGVLALFARGPIEGSVLQALLAIARLGGFTIFRETTPFMRAPAFMRNEIPVAPMAEVQRQAILSALASTGGRLSGPGGAAEKLGMKPTTLESRIRKLGLRKPPRLKL